MGSFLYTLVKYDHDGDLAHVHAFFFSKLLNAAELVLLADPFTFGYAEHLPFEGEGEVRVTVNLYREEVVDFSADAPPEVLRELEQHRLTHPALFGAFFISGAQHLYAVAQHGPRPPRFYATPVGNYVAGVVELDEPLTETYLRVMAFDASGDRVARVLARAGPTALLCPAPVRVYSWEWDWPMLPVPGVELRLDFWLGGDAVERWRPVASLQVEGRLGRAWLEKDGLHLIPREGLTPDRVLAMYEEMEKLWKELISQRLAKSARATLLANDAVTEEVLEEVFRVSDAWVSGGMLYVRPWYTSHTRELERLLSARKGIKARVLPAEQAVFSDEVIAVWRFLRRVEELLS
jgi:hypothetical protein